MARPDGASIADFLPDPPAQIPIFVLLAFIIFALIYAPFAVWDKLKMNLEKNAPYLAIALIAITLIFGQIGIFDEKYNLDLNLLIQESKMMSFRLNEYSLSKTPRLQLSVRNSSESNQSEDCFCRYYRASGQVMQKNENDCPLIPMNVLYIFRCVFSIRSDL